MFEIREYRSDQVFCITGKKQLCEQIQLPQHGGLLRVWTWEVLGSEEDVTHIAKF
jgi:hypothetical protein